MIGRELEELSFEQRQELGRDPVLRVRGFTLPGRVHGVDLAVERGQVVGLAGLVGSGRSTLLAGLFGLEPEVLGTVEVDGAGGARLEPGGGDAARLRLRARRP